MAELEKWRPDIEARFDAKNTFNDKKRLQLWDKIDERYKEMNEQFESVAGDQEKNLEQFDQIAMNFENNVSDKKDIREKIQETIKMIEHQREQIDEEMSNNFQKNWQYTEDAEKNCLE